MCYAAPTIPTRERPQGVPPMRATATTSLSLALAVSLGLAAPAHALTIFTDEWPPLEFSGPSGPQGLTVDVVKEILARQKSRDRIQVVPWARGLHMAKTRPNVLLFTVSGTPERKKILTLLGPVADYQTIFYSRSDRHQGIRTVDDARKVQRVGVYADTIFEDYLQMRGFTNMDISADPETVARKLMFGRIDLWLDADLSAAWILSKTGHPQKDLAARVVVDRTSVYMGFSRGTSPATIRSWYATLQAMQRDGTLARITRKWTPTKLPPARVELTGLPPGTPLPSR